MKKSTIKLLVLTLIIILSILFPSVVVGFSFYSFFIPLIILVLCLCAYVFLLLRSIFEWWFKGIRLARSHLIIHLVFLIVAGSILISRTELVKSKQIFIAETSDIERGERLILRKNGDCHFQKIRQDKVVLWEYEGKYNISGDSINLTTIPYLMYIDTLNEKIWYLATNNIDYNKTDTIFFDILIDVRH